MKLRRRLGQTFGGFLAKFPPRPKGMHWLTHLEFNLRLLDLSNKILEVEVDRSRRFFGCVPRKRSN